MSFHSSNATALYLAIQKRQTTQGKLRINFQGVSESMSELFIISNIVGRVSFARDVNETKLYNEDIFHFASGLYWQRI